MSAVFENVLNSVKEVAGVFCRAFDSFAQINMHEHMNEPFCFVGIKSYKFSDKAYLSANGMSHYNATVKVYIELLSSKTMEAGEIVGMADSIVQVLTTLGEKITSLERKPCEYSKVHSRYITSIEFETPVPVAFRTNDSIYAAINGVTEPFFTAFRVKRGIKTSQVAVVDKVLLSSIVREEPDKVTLIGRISISETDNMVEKLSKYIGTLNTINLGVNTYINMTATSLDVKADDNKTAEISIEFTEVNA